MGPTSPEFVDLQNRQRDTGIDGATISSSELASASLVDNSSSNKENLEQSRENPRKLVTLLPRPTRTSKPVPRRTRRVAFRPNIPGPCGLPQCRRPSCRLSSHRLYVSTQARLQNQGFKPDSADRHPTWYQKSSVDLSPTIAKAAGFPTLPLNESEQSNPIFRQLFHSFFAKILDRFSTLLVPPFLGYPKWLRGRHQELFQNGTNIQVDCLNFLGATHVYFAAHSRGALPDRDYVGIMIYGELMKQLRNTLDKYDAERDAERVLSIIYTLVQQVLCTPQAQNGQYSLIAHRTAMERVVDSRGGVHNMGHSILLALSLDRTIALQMGQLPTYTTWESATLPIQRAPLYSAVYGSFFLSHQYHRIIDDQIVAYCNDVCRAMEILEGENWRFDGQPQESTPEIYYLYYLRDRLTAKFTHLNARFVADDTRHRCVLLAAKLVEYIALWDDFLAPTTILVANGLRNTISQQDIGEVWKQWDDVFQWIAFVLACVPDYWTGSEWAATMCFQALQRTYGRRWPARWQRKQSDNLMRFVWSTTRLGGPLRDVCAQMQVMAHRQLEDREAMPLGTSSR